MRKSLSTKMHRNDEHRMRQYIKNEEIEVDYVIERYPNVIGFKRFVAKLLKFFGIVLYDYPKEIELNCLVSLCEDGEHDVWTAEDENGKNWIKDLTWQEFDAIIEKADKKSQSAVNLGAPK